MSTTKIKPSKSLAFLLIFTLAFAPVIATRKSDDPQQWTPQDPCPTKIKAVVPRSAPFGNHDVIHEAMKICSNITELDLYAGYFPVSCVDFDSPARWSLPFALDGSDRYLSAPRALILENYEFGHSEWQSIVPPGPGWFNKDGRWPRSYSPNPVIAWCTDQFYQFRWFIELLETRLTGSLHPGAWYWWLESGSASRWKRWHHLPEEQRNKENLDLWLDAMDFSQVETLSIKQVGFMPKPKGDALLHRLPKALTGLKSLTIGGRWVDWGRELELWEAEPGPLPKNKWISPRPPRALDFILRLVPSSLTNLTWSESETCDPDVFDAVMQHHGSSLRHLEWTNSELEHYPRLTLSTEQLKKLGKWAPELTNLTIDLGRENQDWPRAKLKILAQSLPRLKDLAIYLNLAEHPRNATVRSPGMSTDTLLAKPLLDNDAAGEMFKLLRESQAGDALETVTFREGNWRHESYTMDLQDREGWVDGVRDWVTCSRVLEGRLLEDSSWCVGGRNKEYGRFLNGSRW
ncbi:hypothetical protein ACJ41O_013031 [Fusarium nematophilum]